MLLAESCQKPIGIFWDIENCGIPKKASASDLVNKIRSDIVKVNNYREYEFFCGCDITKLSKKKLDELNLAGVTVAHVSSGAKNSADEKIKEQMSKFVDTHGARATVMLLSGDVNFAPTLRGFRDRIGAKVILMHSNAVAKDLINSADEIYNYAQFCSNNGELEQMTDSKENKVSYMLLTGFSTKLPIDELADKLCDMFAKYGGNVVNIETGTACIKFDSSKDAENAMQLFNENDVTINDKSINAFLCKKMPKLAKNVTSD